MHFVCNICFVEMPDCLQYYLLRVVLKCLNATTSKKLSNMELTKYTERENSAEVNSVPVNF